MTKKEFSKIVKKALENGVSIRELSDKFEVAEYTVLRWASGNCNPHPNIRTMVVKELKNNSRS
jgi:hypothetical protein